VYVGAFVPRVTYLECISELAAELAEIAEGFFDLRVLCGQL
jgi:hypothetical protein